MSAELKTNAGQWPAALVPRTLIESGEACTFLTVSSRSISQCPQMLTDEDLNWIANGRSAPPLSQAVSRMQRFLQRACGNKDAYCLASSLTSCSVSGMDECKRMAETLQKTNPSTPEFPISLSYCTDSKHSKFPLPTEHSASSLDLQEVNAKNLIMYFQPVLILFAASAALGLAAPVSEPRK